MQSTNGCLLSEMHVYLYEGPLERGAEHQCAVLAGLSSPACLTGSNMLPDRETE